eukprot:scaffold731_cov261-Pinguiococcus_pyrenoidosus.AAC.116
MRRLRLLSQRGRASMERTGPRRPAFPRRCDGDLDGSEKAGGFRCGLATRVGKLRGESDGGQSGAGIAEPQEHHTGGPGAAARRRALTGVVFVLAGTSSCMRRAGG